MIAVIYIYIYIYYNPSFNHLPITRRVLIKQKSNFVIALVKGIRLVRKMPEYTTEFSK